MATQKPKLTRADRAEAAFRRGVIVTRTATGYTVPSSKPGESYDITELNDGTLYCTCPDSIYRSHQGESCYHVLLALKVREFLPKEAPVIAHVSQREQIVVV